jgi:hypothetical protein
MVRVGSRMPEGRRLKGFYNRRNQEKMGIAYYIEL